MICFSLQLAAREGHDIFRCMHCGQIQWAGEGWWCRKCGADASTMDVLTDRCERCNGDAPRTAPGGVYRECVNCGHLFRTDVVPRPYWPPVRALKEL